MKNSSTQKLKELEKKIKNLEQAVGQKQIKIDFLEKIIQLSGQHYQTDLKKTFGT
jgi:myosin-crossreactive antigen